MIWVLILLLSGCAMQDYKPEPVRCVKVWDKSTSRAVYECTKVSQSTLDGER